MLNVTPLISRRPLPMKPLTLDAEARKPRLRLAADGMTASAILDAIADLLQAGRGGPEGDAVAPAEVVVDVTNAWSIPWTTQPLRLAVDGRATREAYVRHKGFRWSEDRTEAVYEVAEA